MRRLPILCLLLGLLSLGGCARQSVRPPDVELRAKTEIERRATLSILRRQWTERPRDLGDEQPWYERRLLNRLGFFGRKVERTETHREACRFWLECLHEHRARFPD